MGGTGKLDAVAVGGASDRDQISVIKGEAFARGLNEGQVSRLPSYFTLNHTDHRFKT